MNNTQNFQEEYAKLNPAQKEAVEALSGPVMVVAGPGTGKTQILALRIANILRKTDIKADGILCLTFTNSAVEAMKTRLARYIGAASEKVNVFTFHSFGMKVISEHFKVLGLPAAPKLLEDIDRAIFFDQILSENDWEYLRPRSDRMRYFHDLMSLASLLKRERIETEYFHNEIKKEINFLESDEASLASRGESKGQIKKEVLKEIESLKRSEEVVKFLNLYEKAKKERNFFDYDDVLENLVRLVEISAEVKSLIRERYLYVLVDEHQDSSRVQNEFLTAVWAGVEKPDIFVVGDDRQLIYGFSGASIAHFKSFRETFPEAKLITLVDNYRSTQVILDAAHALLQSVMSDKKLVSQNKEKHPIRLIEADTQNEEIVALCLDLKAKIKEGLKPNDCALLLPKNRQILNAVKVLHSFGIPVSSLDSVSLFDEDAAQAFLRVLKIIDTGDPVSLARSFLDVISAVSPLEAHTFFVEENMRDFSLEKILNKSSDLFSSSSNVRKWIDRLAAWRNDAQKDNPEYMIRKISGELFESEEEKNKLVTGKEIADTFLALLFKEKGKNPEITLSQFASFLDKIAAYDEDIPLVSKPKEGVKILTMHSAKGLEFEYVWIAHMDEKSLAGGKRPGFTLPSVISERLLENDLDAIKRKLYVAITRAKRFCTLSYATGSHKGGEQELAKVIDELPPEVFHKERFSSPKEKILPEADLSDIVKLAKNKYKDRYVSVSLLNNFFDCPRQWYFRNLLQLPEAKTESLEFGNAVHAAIDQILKSKKVILPEDREVAKVVSAWAERRLPEIASGYENEQSVSVSDPRFPHFKIYGRIDLIENLSGNNLRVTDFKTGNVRKKSEIEKLDEEGRMSGNLRQLAMYSYLIKQSPKWKGEVSESRLEFLEAKNPKEAFYDKFITDQEINLLLKDIEDYDQLVKSGEWINRPCNYNSYGKNTECPYCKLMANF